MADVLIVGSDANCQGFVARRNAILKAVSKSPYPKVIPAIPDPHVERWFMVDMQALRAASGVDLRGDIPQYKCDKNRYKTLLREAFRDTGVMPPLGGIEYGSRVASLMDLYSSCKYDTGLSAFVSDFRSWLRQCKTSGG